MALITTTYARGLGQRVQDLPMSPATLADGTMFQRLDRLAYPKLLTKSIGTDGNGYAVPKAARTTHGAGS